MFVENDIECFFEFPSEGYRVGVILKTPKRQKRILELSLVDNHTIEVFNASMQLAGVLRTQKSLLPIMGNEVEDQAEEIVTNMDHFDGRSHVGDRIKFGDFELHDDQNGMAVMYNEELLACIEEFIVFIVFQLFENEELVETSFLYSLNQ